MEHLELTIEEVSSLSKEDQEELEILSKACPRCGSASANKSNPSGRCRKHLDQLASNKKKPGHWQRAQTKFDDSKRRENGKNGTASYKSKGRAKSRKDFVKRFKSDEKKAGAKLSPDRINNKRGYESKNVRNVPEKLNRGRHKVDPKKLSAWKKRLKKSDIDLDDLMVLLQAKALEHNNTELAKSLEMIDAERMLAYLGFYDEEDTEQSE
jgi:ribosomal protein S27AE